MNDGDILNFDSSSGIDDTFSSLESLGLNTIESEDLLSIVSFFSSSFPF